MLVRKFSISASCASSTLGVPFKSDIECDSWNYLSVRSLRIMYKTRLPFLLVFNKTDIQPHDFALEWMRDFEAFQSALTDRRSTGADDGPGYMDSLMNSMSLVLDEFYQHLRAVGVSAMTGDGMVEFFEAVEEARKEYDTYVSFFFFAYPPLPFQN